MTIFNMFETVSPVFQFFKDFFSVMPAEIRLAYFSMFGILMFFGIYFMFKR